MKTVKEWLQELPDGYRERALGQMVAPEKNADSIGYAVLSIAVWEGAAEGWEFWDDVYKHYTQGTPLPPLPEEAKPTVVIQPGFPTSRTTAEMIAIMQQYEEGDEWECRDWESSMWRSCDRAFPAWQWYYNDYRKKPEPKVVKVKKWAHLMETRKGDYYIRCESNKLDKTQAIAKILAAKEIEIEFTIGEGL